MNVSYDIFYLLKNNILVLSQEMSEKAIRIISRPNRNRGTNLLMSHDSPVIQTTHTHDES